METLNNLVAIMMLKDNLLSNKYMMNKGNTSIYLTWKHEKTLYVERRSKLYYSPLSYIYWKMMNIATKCDTSTMIYNLLNYLAKEIKRMM